MRAILFLLFDREHSKSTAKAHRRKESAKKVPGVIWHFFASPLRLGVFAVDVLSYSWC
jgi:hypothetical protein